MSDATEYKLDRSRWSRGPWDDEPEDRVEWRDAATGLVCLIARGPLGAWCGYVAVPPGHALHGVDYNRIDCDAVNPHGGLTYSERCNGRAICHVPQPGESDDVWWLGFDCAHSCDVVPAMPDKYEWHSSYRGRAYVVNQVTEMAGQIAAAGTDAVEAVRT